MAKTKPKVEPRDPNTPARLFSAGDNRAARDAARRALADPAATPDAKAEAEHVLRETSVDRSALLAALGVLGVIVVYASLTLFR